MPKYFSASFKQRMVERLTGRNAISAGRLAKEVGVSQDSLSRWLREASSPAALRAPAHRKPLRRWRPHGRDEGRVRCAGPSSSADRGVANLERLTLAWALPQDLRAEAGARPRSGPRRERDTPPFRS